MYKRILLAYDGSVEGRTALREGTFLLTEVTLAGASVRMEDDFIEILNEGVARLKNWASIPWPNW